MKQLPIFVVGVPRSGTTLLQAILSRSRQTYTLPETHFFEAVLPALGRRPTDSLEDYEINEALESLKKVMALAVDDTKANELKRQAGQGNLNGQQLFFRLLEYYRPADDEACRRRPVEKTPGHIQHLDEILEACPGAKFIHILREPKNAISSLLGTPFVKTRWLLWHVARWNATVGYAEQFRRSHPTAILTVRYEELVSDSEATVQRICRFAGLRYEPQMLDNEDPGTAQRIMLPEETWKAAALGPIRTNHNDVWRERICREQGWFIDRQTKRQRAYFGYESDIRLSRRISAAAEWRNWTYLRRHAEDTSEGTWLLDKCLTLGQKGPARQVAMGLLLGDWRRIRQPAIQSAMRGL